MDNIKIEQTKSSPAIDFNFKENIFTLQGDSFPGNVTAFFEPPLRALEHHLAKLSDGNVEFNFEIIYFNYSSAKIIMKLFNMLDQTAKRGIAITVNWYFDKEHGGMEEIGEKFGKDLKTAEFNLRPIQLKKNFQVGTQE